MHAFIQTHISLCILARTHNTHTVPSMHKRPQTHTYMHAHTCKKQSAVCVSRFSRHQLSPSTRLWLLWSGGIGVRDGGQGGASAPPPIRAVCRHEFGQRVDIIRAKHNTCLNNTNLGTVTGVNGKMEYGSRKIIFLLLPPPTEYGKNPVCPPPNGCWPVRLCLAAPSLDLFESIVSTWASTSR